MYLSLPPIEDDFTGSPVAPRRNLLQIVLMALVCALVSGRASTASSLAEREQTPPPVVPERTTIPVRAVSDPLAGVARSHTKSTLRPGNRLHVFYVIVGWDGSNDDETSYDSADDDDDEGVSTPSAKRRSRSRPGSRSGVATRATPKPNPNPCGHNPSSSHPFRRCKLFAVSPPSRVLPAATADIFNVVVLHPPRDLVPWTVQHRHVRSGLLKC